MKPHQSRYELGLALKTTRAAVTTTARTSVKHRNGPARDDVEAAQRLLQRAAKLLARAVGVAR